MALTTDDVRGQLVDVIKDYVSDSIIQQQLELAKIKVNAEKSNVAKDKLMKYAVLTQATYLTYLAYAEAVRREVGEMPLAFELQLDKYLQEAERGLELARRRKRHFPRTLSRLK